MTIISARWYSVNTPPENCPAGSRRAVDELTSLLENDGFSVMSYPRTTGDGYYESAVEDPEGNAVEITV